MNFRLFGRACRHLAIGAILLCSASCIYVNEELGGNLIPTDQKWDVFTPEAIELSDIKLQMADSLSAYSSTRFTFGAICDPVFGTSIKSTSFTLVPLSDTLDFGTNTKVKGFHFTAVRDTVSTIHDNQQRIIQNVYVSELRTKLDTNALYTGTFMDPANREKYLDTENLITIGVPVYDGGDSLSFNFSLDFAESMVNRLKSVTLDSLDLYTEAIPGIYITTDAPAMEGGRINMFKLALETGDGYITGNYAQLFFTADYGTRKDVDTSFIFLFGPGAFVDNDSSELPTQFAFNTSNHSTGNGFIEEWEAGNKTTMLIEGGGGIKPVITAREIKEKVLGAIAEAGIIDVNEVVINKATIQLPYTMPADYTDMDNFPQVLSPTVRLRSSEGNYVTYAGLTDSSIGSEDQGEINRSICMYTPDISHHVQEIIKLDDEKKLENYDIWMMIMIDEVVESSNSNSNYDDYMNSLLYSSYYNNMMYGGYGGYGGYGYGYNNYYNYMMMAAMANSYSTSETSERALDKDRYYNGVLNGPGAEDNQPRLKITFSAPKSAEE